MYLKTPQDKGAPVGRRLATACALAAIPVLAAGIRLGAQAPAGQSFTTLAPGFTQELFATADVGTFPAPNDAIAKVLGGVAFAPDGDVWAADCVFQDTTLHRFDTTTLAPAMHGTTSRHAETMTVPTQGGCGLVNHPDGALYSNSVQGIYKLDANTGMAVAGPMGPVGNALGIAVDPVTGHLVYPGADCHDSLVPGAPTCTLWDLDPTTGAYAPFALFPHADVPFVDGLYFSPTGSHLFVTNRTETDVDTAAGTVRLSELTVVGRPTGPVTVADTSQIVQNLPMTSEPDGVSFHATQNFVVTNDEGGGTMTRFDFPGGDFSQAPTGFTEIQPVDGLGAPVGDPIRVYGSSFASGGHRGDLTQVGPDGCIYATQGRDFFAAAFGTRYDDLTETSEDSIVKICSTSGGFQPPPGVTTTDSHPGSIEGSVYLDVNHNHAIDATDTLLPGVAVALSGAATSSANSTGGPVPTYAFAGLNAGAYTVSAPAVFSGYALSASTPGSVAATITAAGEHVTGVDFLYEAGSLTGSVYLDEDDDGSISAGDSLLGGVAVALSGPSTGSTTSGTGPAPTYSFLDLQGGGYTVNVPATFNGYKLAASTPTPQARTLAAGGAQSGVNFLYVRGRLSGFAYVDANNNGSRDPGETPLGGVTISVPGTGTTTTAADGSYAFKGLAASVYSVGASTPAGGYALSTPSPLSITVPAGGDVPNVNFGYRPGDLSGFAYVDVNRNGVKDAAEPGLANVAIVLGSGGTAITGANGAYAFNNLVAGNYTLAAPASAVGYALGTANPLAASLAAGGSVANLNFGYVPGAISGFAYKDTNNNGVKDANEPGIGNVTVTLSGAAGLTAVSASDGSYHFTSLLAGSYSVSAPATAAGLNRSTPSPLAVALAAGQSVPNVNFGYRDATAPVCAVFGNANPPYMTYQDTGSGIVRLDVTKNLNSNFKVTITPGPNAFSPSVANPSAMPTGTVATYATPTNALIYVYAQRINTSQSAQLIVQATDAFGNIVSCDPVETTVTRLRHDRGIQTFTDIPFAEHFITIENDTPGLRALDIIVNGVEFRARSLADGEVRRVNVRSAMQPGNNNTITLVPRGRPGESADITIAARQ